MGKKSLLTLISCLILVSVGNSLAQVSTPTPTPVITTLDDESATDISLDDLEIIIEAAEGQEIDPPLTLDLPDDWQSGNGTAVIQDIFGLQLLPFTLYTGPVTGGEGFIVVIWGYETTGLFNSETGESILSPYTDALRLLRFALIGPDCVPGIDVEKEFEVGGIVAQGSNFSAYRCEETLDTRGWFVGLQIEGVNMSIYAYTEPIEAMDGIAPQEIQAILDTAEFDIEGLLARLAERRIQLEADATATAQASASQTPTTTATETP
jgi:hypothetical protein